MIRLARGTDAAAIAEIYAPIVAESAISFEEQPPDSAEMARRIGATGERYPYLVFDAGGVDGYAYATAFRTRPAYRWSVEVSAYVREQARGKGVGRRLYRALLGVLEAQGFHMAYAGIALPNDASCALHRSRGFEPIGIYRDAGYKFGRWHDVGWFQRPLAVCGGEPREPIALASLQARVLDDCLAED